MKKVKCPICKEDMIQSIVDGVYICRKDNETFTESGEKWRFK